MVLKQLWSRSSCALEGVMALQSLKQLWPRSSSGPEVAMTPKVVMAFTKKGKKKGVPPVLQCHGRKPPPLSDDVHRELIGARPFFSFWSALYRLYTGSVSAPYRLHIGSVSAPDRLHIPSLFHRLFLLRISSVSALHRLSAGSSAIPRLYIGPSSVLHRLHIASLSPPVLAYAVLARV